MTVNREKLDKLGRFLLRNDWTGGLSAGVAWLVFLQVPARCRQAEHWAELVRHGLLDGALLSSFCLERRLLSAQLPHWEGVVVLPPVPAPGLTTAKPGRATRFLSTGTSTCSHLQGH